MDAVMRFVFLILNRNEHDAKIPGVALGQYACFAGAAAWAAVAVLCDTSQYACLGRDPISLG